MKNGFTLIEIIFSITLIALIGGSFLILNKDNNENENYINRQKEKILLSSDIFIDINNLKAETYDKDICIKVSKLYEKGLIGDETYNIAKDRNYVYVQYNINDLTDNKLVGDSTNCIVVDPEQYIEPNPQETIELFINVNNTTEETEINNYFNTTEFQDYLKNKNIELKVSFANFNSSTNTTYEFKDPVICSTSVNNDTMAFLGNYIIIHYWDSNWRQRRFTSCNVVTGSTSNPFKDESGLTITPSFNVEYATEYHTHTPWDDVDTAKTYSYFRTDSTKKKLVYQTHKYGGGGRCDVDSDETQWSNAGDYGYYYLRWNFCFLENTNDLITCATEIEKEVYSGAHEDVCEWRSERQYESPTYNNKTHFNLGDQNMVDNIKSISYDERKIGVYNYIGGITSVPTSIKNNLTIDNLYSLGKLPTASKNKYDAYEVTYNNERIYYKNGDWYGTPIYTSHKPGSSWRYNYYINWVKENKTTVYSFNNVNREGNIIDCSNNLCMSYKRVISTTGVNNINSLNDIKQLIENYITN